MTAPLTGSQTDAMDTAALMLVDDAEQFQLGITPDMDKSGIMAQTQKRQHRRGTI